MFMTTLKILSINWNQSGELTRPLDFLTNRNVKNKQQVLTPRRREVILQVVLHGSQECSSAADTKETGKQKVTFLLFPIKATLCFGKKLYASSVQRKFSFLPENPSGSAAVVGFGRIYSRQKAANTFWTQTRGLGHRCNVKLKESGDHQSH